MSEKLKAAARQLMDVVLCFAYHGKAAHWAEAANAYYAALAEQTVPSDCADSHQPAAWLDQDINASYTAAEMDGDSTEGLVPLYAAPPQREPAQEPVAWMDIAKDGTRLSVRQWSDRNSEEVPLYTAPPQRKTLTDEAIKVMWDSHRAALPRYLCFARAVERKVRGEKE